MIPATRDELTDESGWYVVYAKPRQETRALEDLCNQEGRYQVLAL